jgi:putative transposase
VRQRGDLLNGEIFTTLREAQLLIESWRRHYNGVCPHLSLGYRPPAPQAILPPVRTDNYIRQYSYKACRGSVAE